MLEVKIQGFQSIEKVNFTIGGFTVLVGRSNIGKSAIVRAVQAALTNALGTDFVRHGDHCSRRIRGTKKCRCQCSVHIQTEGMDLLWEKGDEVNRYTYNGEVYSKVGQGIPDFLTKDFSLVKVGDRKQLVQVAEQFEPIFLLNQSGTVVADVLSDVAKLDDINAAMTEVERDRREAVSTLKVREKDVQELQTSLCLYEGSEEPIARAKRVGKVFDSIQEKMRAKAQVEQFHAKLQKLVHGIRALQPIDAVNIPDSEPVETSEKGLEVILEYEAHLAEKTAAVANLEPVEGIFEPETETLEAVGETLTQIEDWLAEITIFKAIFSGWKEVEKTTEPSEIPLQEIHALLQLTTFANQYEMLMAATEELEVVELTEGPDESIQEIDGLLALASFTEKHQELSTVVTRLTEDLIKMEGQEATVLGEWSDLGLCPTCSQSLSEGHTLHLDA